MWHPANDPSNPGAYTVAGLTTVETLKGGGVATFPANIHAQTGDLIGFVAVGLKDFAQYGGSYATVDNCIFAGSGTVDYLRTFSNDGPGFILQQLGESIEFLFAQGQFVAGYDLNLSATLRQG